MGSRIGKAGPMEDDVRVAQATEQDVWDFVFDDVDRRFFLERLRRPGLRSGRILLAFVNSAPAGHLYVRLPPAEEAELRELLPGVPLLERLLVFDTFRKKGVGQALVAVAEELLRDLGYVKVALGVEPDNTVAIRFYERLGFAVWRDELVTTYKEHVGPSGQLAHEEDMCRMYVKSLLPAASA
jgi:GNAT superfamily N-acetyltransferase